MSVNSFSSANESLLKLDSCFNYTFMCCLISSPSSFIFVAYTLTSVFFVLPMCIVVLHHGLRHWRQNRSASSAATKSHSDVFTHHMVAMELLSVFGNVLCCCGAYKKHFITMLVGSLIFSYTWYGQMLFHILTCVERYVAVVHPIAYRSLRNERGVRFRRASIVCVWLLCFIGQSVMTMEDIFIMLDLCLLVVSLFSVLYCSLAVLCVLIRPRPGKRGGARERVDQSKQRAFYTIVTILGVLVAKFAWNLSCIVLYYYGGDSKCIIAMCFIIFNLSSSLVLPLLFLQREGKLF